MTPTHFCRLEILPRPSASARIKKKFKLIFLINLVVVFLGAMTAMDRFYNYFVVGVVKVMTLFCLCPREYLLHQQCKENTKDLTIPHYFAGPILVYFMP